MRGNLFFIIGAIFLFSCAKKALDVKEDMYFEQVNWVEPPGERDPIAGVAPMSLDLRTNGFAGLYPGSGDIVWSGTYKVTAKKIKVRIDNNDQTYEFEIKSTQELRGPNGQILHLKQE